MFFEEGSRTWQTRVIHVPSGQGTYTEAAPHSHIHLSTIPSMESNARENVSAGTVPPFCITTIWKQSTCFSCFQRVWKLWKPWLMYLWLFSFSIFSIFLNENFFGLVIPRLGWYGSTIFVLLISSKTIKSGFGPR